MKKVDKDLKKSMERLSNFKLDRIAEECNYPAGNQKMLKVAKTILAERKKRKMQKNEKEVGAWTW